MALFQEQATANDFKTENNNKIYQDFKGELDSIYSDRQQTVQKRKEEESLYVKNLVSPEKIKEWQDKGNMSALEVWNRKSKNELIPYMSTFKEGEKSFKLKSISDKIRNGQYITPEERKQFDSFVLDMAEVQTRGYSFGGGAMNIGLETLPFMAEFGIGLLTTGGGASFASSMAKGGVKATAKEIGKTVTKTLAEKSLGEIGKDVVKGAGQTLYNATLNPKTYAFGATRLPQQLYARWGDIQLSESIYVSEEGQTILEEAKTKPAIALMKALALTNIETASEMSGEILVRPIMQGLGRIVAPKVLREMASKTFPEKFVKLAEEVTKMPFARAVDTLGWNGVLEEIGEERIGDLLQFAFNLDGKDGYSFEQLLDAVFPSGEQFGQEALAFAVTGVGMNAVHSGLNKVSPKYSKDGFLLDSGIFRISGYDNLVDKRVKSILQKQGKTEEEIEDAVNFSTREDKIEFLKQNNMNLDDDIKEVQEDYKKSLLADGVSEDRAEFASKIYATLQTSRADRTGRSLEELHAENNLKIKEVEDEQFQDLVDYYETNYPEEFEQLAQVAGAEEGEYTDALREWKEKGTESSYFKKWFGDSKVVDENGKPLVVYHGTREIFDTFDNNKKGKASDTARIGFWFTDSSKFAENFASDIWYGEQENPITMPVYISMKNPKIYEPKKFDKKELDSARNKVNEIEQQIKDLSRKFNKILIETGSFVKATEETKQEKDLLNAELKEAKNIYAELRYSDSYEQLRTDIRKIEGGNAEDANFGGLGMVLKNQDTVEKFVESLKAQGYDGVIIKQTSYDSQSAETETNNQYAVFEPEQIKSVNNQGTFNKNNPNIYFQTEIDRNNIENNFDDTVENITEIIKGDIENILAENNVDDEEFKIEDIRIYGSYSTGRNKKSSDLDFLVSYSGTMREDGAFNMFADNDLYLTDKNGKQVKVDINPINIKTSGTIDEHIEYMNSLEPKRYFQSAYHGTPHKFDKFSIESIGTGEGNQAHGWGLYFAENKEVSEKYREKLSNYKRNGQRSLDEEYENLLIDGKPILENYDIDIDRTVYNFIHAPAVQSSWLNSTKDFLKKKTEEWQDLLKDEDYPFKDYAKTKVDAYKRLLKDISNGATIKDKAEGQLFKVDVPEKENLLDEDKKYSEQSKTVQEALKKLYEDNWEKYPNSNHIKLAEIIYTDNTSKKYANNLSYKEGRYIYEYISDMVGSDKKASELLNKYGIKGITYDGTQDGRCYVVFDDKAVKVLETYYQEEPEQQSVFEGNNKARDIRKIKGAYMPAENLIEFFKNADESTIVHEFAHWYLDNLVNDAKYHEASAEDLAEVRKFVRNNGEDFTREQHEKFARGFEAYIRSGRARTNRLKKIFEDFKNALLQIYDTITQIVYTENGIEKPFTDEDMPQINSLFERLLSTENERIQATVFDKVNEIEDKINVIKENQQKEFDELDTIYRDNIEILNRKSDQKRKVEEYLELAEKTARREPKELKEWKKRYKEATLQILSQATGYDKRYIANPRNWERVQMALEHADDKITVSGGMESNWREFYSDTGVSYDNDEVHGDYELAQQAFDTLVNDSYNKTYSDNYGFEEIEEFTGKFDYLESKVKSLKGNEQQNAYEALSKLVFEKSPEMPEEVYEDFIHRLVNVGEKMEDIQKEDFNRKNYPNIPVVQQLQFYVTNKLNNLKIYNPETRYKTRLDKSHGLYRSIKSATSVNQTKKIIQKINNFIIEDMRNNQRAILNKEIQKQIKINSKLVKVGSIKRGKFDWRTNTVFAELVQMNKLSQEEASNEFKELLKLNELEAGEERMSWRDDSAELSDTMKSDFQDNLKRKFLQYKSSRLKALDVQHTTSLLEDIMKLKFEGRRAKDAEDLKKRTEKLDYRNNLIQILDKHKDNKTAKFLTNWVVGSGTLGNWETLLNTVFDDATAKKYSLQGLEAQVQIFARRKTLELIEKANRIYGFENNKWDKVLDFDGMQKFIKLMQDYANETFDYSETTWNKETFEAVQTGLKISKAEIMTLYTWSLNDELLQRLNNQYGVVQLQDMFSRLSEKDKQMCWEFVNVCESMYDDMNEVYIETYGISLPKVQNYFPSVTERVGSDLDMFHDFVVKSSNPSFIKQRKTCNKIPMKPKQPLEILLPHINKSANYILMSETVNFYNKIFKETPLNKKIVDVYGKKDGDKIVRAIQNQLSASTFTTVARGLSFAHEFADNLATNFISSSIAGSPKVMLSQLLSVINYAENMPAHEWQAGFLKALAKPKETFEYMMSNCEYLQARLAGNTQNEMMATLTSEVDRFRTLKNFASMNTKWGDILAIIFGGKPYVDYLMSQGMSEEEAFKKFVDDTLRAQQAGLASTTSEWQKAQTKTAMGRAIFAFNNTNLQYERKFIDALSRFSKGDMTTLQFAKSYMIYKILNPIMFTSILGNLSLLELTNALMGGDDEPQDALRRFGTDLLLAIMLGSLGAYGIAGLLAIAIINYGKAYIDKKIFGEKPFVFKSSVPILNVVDDVGTKLMKKETTFADYVDVVGSVGDISTGLPFTRTLNSVGGMYDVSQGEFGIGATRMIGYGEYKATNAWTGQSPKERKKNKK